MFENAWAENARKDYENQVDKDVYFTSSEFDELVEKLREEYEIYLWDEGVDEKLASTLGEFYSKQLYTFDDCDLDYVDGDGGMFAFSELDKFKPSGDVKA